MRTILVATLFAATVLGTSAHAADIAAGKEKAELCVGCHGEAGVTIAQKVPDLKDQIGYFLHLPEGRAYLVRLPNVAFAPISDKELADMMNYMVFTLGGSSAPKDAKPYSAAEVGKLRKQPLTEVPLFQYRSELVEHLISDYQAPEAMRLYGQGLYD